VPKVDRYRMVLYGKSPEAPNLKAKIELYNQSGDTLSSAGRIRFHAGDTLPSDAGAKGNITMNMPSSQIADVVDVLRNERPIYFAFHEGRAVLGTGIEPIGSRESSAPRLVAVVDKPPTPEPELKEPTEPAE
jgi:hypothetical protein